MKKLRNYHFSNRKHNKKKGGAHGLRKQDPERQEAAQEIKATARSSMVEQQNSGYAPLDCFMRSVQVRALPRLYENSQIKAT